MTTDFKDIILKPIDTAPFKDDCKRYEIVFPNNQVPSNLCERADLSDKAKARNICFSNYSPQDIFAFLKVDKKENFIITLYVMGKGNPSINSIDIPVLYSEQLLLSELLYSISQETIQKHKRIGDFENER